MHFPLTEADLTRAQLEREAAADAAELQRITQPLPIDSLVTDSAFVLRESEHREPAAMPGMFEVERRHPWLLALYAATLLLALGLSALFPLGFAWVAR